MSLPRSPAWDETLMILPLFCAFMCGATAWQQKIVLIRLTSRMNRASASGIIEAKPRSKGVSAPPALLTRMSIRPSSRTICSTMASTWSFRVTSA